MVIPTLSIAAGTGIPLALRITVRGPATSRTVCLVLLLPLPSSYVMVTKVSSFWEKISIIVPFEILIIGITNIFLFFLLYSCLPQGVQYVKRDCTFRTASLTFYRFNSCFLQGINQFLNSCQCFIRKLVVAGFLLSKAFNSIHTILHCRF